VPELRTRKQDDSSKSIGESRAQTPDGQSSAERQGVEGAAYFNDVEGIEAKIVGEVCSGGDLHKAVSDEYKRTRGRGWEKHGERDG
jgi:hypothetical protein